MKLCSDCKEKLFDWCEEQIRTDSDGVDWCEEQIRTYSDDDYWWLEDFLDIELFELTAKEIFVEMGTRGWYCCEYCGLWTRYTDDSGLCDGCSNRRGV